MNQKDLDKIVADHKLWLEDHKDGVRANLTSADLRYANLRSADLRYADLRYANLRSANLRSANLRSADLRYANLRYANLRYADLRSADLRSANLRSADLRYANLRYADLRSANLRSANLRSADLRSADLRYANLRYADLRKLDLSIFSIVPDVGGFIGFKKLSGGVVAKLQIMAGAKRLNSIGSRKCRASKVKVLSLSNGVESAFNNTHRKKIEYAKGDVIEVSNYCDDVRIECAEGIHFFITKKEAENW